MLTRYRPRLEQLESRLVLSRDSVAFAFATSDEYLTNLVTGLYEGYLGREAQPEEVQMHLSALASGMSEESLEAHILASAERLAGFTFSSTVSAPALLDTERFVTQTYFDELSRLPDQAGFEHWVTALNSGSTTRYQFVLDVLMSAEGLDTYTVLVFEGHLLRRPTGANLGDLNPGPELADCRADRLDGATRADLRAKVFASNEYYGAVFAGQFTGIVNTSDEQWARWLHYDVLDKVNPATDAEVTAYLAL